MTFQKLKHKYTVETHRSRIMNAKLLNIIYIINDQLNPTQGLKGLVQFSFEISASDNGGKWTFGNTLC